MEPEVEVSIADFHLFSCLYVGLLILDFPRSHLPLQFIQRCDSCFFQGEELEEEGEDGEKDGLDPFAAPDVDILDAEPETTNDKPRKTTKYMTKYERARVLGTRALQIR